MVKKKKKVEDIEGDLEDENYLDEEEVPEPVDEETEEEEAEDPVIKLEAELKEHIALLKKAILLDRKYIKELWIEIKQLKDNFRLLTESK